MHVPPGDVAVLLFLDMEPGIGELVEIADMVPMHVADDHVVDLGRVDADEAQPLAGTAEVLVLPAARRFLGKAHVDDDDAVGALGAPDEEIHRHRPVMRVSCRRLDEEGVAAFAMRIVGVPHRVEVVTVRLRQKGALLAWNGPVPRKDIRNGSGRKSAAGRR